MAKADEAPAASVSCDVCDRPMVAWVDARGGVFPHIADPEHWRCGYLREKAAREKAEQYGMLVHAAESVRAVETVLGFAEKWADGKRRDREAFEEAAPLVRALASGYAGPKATPPEQLNPGPQEGRE